MDEHSDDSIREPAYLRGFGAGGEGGIRTRCGPVLSASCRFYAAIVPLHAMIAMLACPILPDRACQSDERLRVSGDDRRLCHARTQEPPPAFSGLFTDTAKRFGITVSTQFRGMSGKS
jgi:hypothetical protein